MFLTLTVEALISLGVRAMRIPAGLSETAFLLFSGMKGQDNMNTKEIINIYCPVPQDCGIVLLCPKSAATPEH